LLKLAGIRPKRTIRAGEKIFSFVLIFSHWTNIFACFSFFSCMDQRREWVSRWKTVRVVCFFFSFFFYGLVAV
jgi:hypothetical protein